MTIKVAIIGPEKSGKTSIVNSLCNKEFREEYNETMGVNYASLRLDNERVDLVDTSGDNRFQSTIRFFLKDVLCVFIVFNKSNPSCKQQIVNHYHLAKDNCRQGTKFIILSNQTDNESDYYAETQLSELLPDVEDELTYIPVNPKTNEGRDEIKEELKKFIIKKTQAINLLNAFEEKINSIGEYSAEAKGVALNLHKKLRDLLTKDNLGKEYVVKQTNFLISNAIPILQRDLNWGDYLVNLAKEICNAVTKTASLGFYGGFFDIKKSKAVTKIEELQTELSVTFGSIPI